MESMIEAYSNFHLSRLVVNLGSFLRTCLFRTLAVGPIPTHIAFIMDGNRRYAKKHNLKEATGYHVGFLALMAMLKYCYELGVKYVTVYAFSIDNFKRRPDEVQLVMDLMEEKIGDLLREESFLEKHGVKVHFIGNLKLLQESTRVAAEKAMIATANNDKAVLLICVAYTSTDEIVHAVENAYHEKYDRVQELAYSNGTSDEGVVQVGVDEEAGVIKVADIERHMYLAFAPDPDLLIRTSGETRLSNFLLWQTAHCHLYSPRALWPAISLWDLVWAIVNFQRVHPYLEKKKKSA